MSRTLWLTRGLPASGKTTRALEWVNEAPLLRARVNRDELRNAVYGVYWGLDYKQERAITEVQRAAVRALLQSGKSVVVDDTNLRLKYARAWADLAHEEGVAFTVVDLMTDVEECVRRDAARLEAGQRGVGEAVIRGMAEQYGGRREPVLPTSGAARRDGWRPPAWEPTPGLEEAWLFDLDGTLAHNDGHRGWYDYARVEDDKAWPAVVRMAQALAGAGELVICMSGRSEDSREGTEAWLKEHLGWVPPLTMRKSGDRRPDEVIKSELFDEHIRGRWNVVGVVDDRPKVVRAWRAMGLFTFAVGDQHTDF